MKYANVLKAAKKLDLETKELEDIVNDYYDNNANPFSLERNTIEEIANTVVLASYTAHVIEGAILAINKQIPEYEFVGFLRQIKLHASLGEK